MALLEFISYLHGKGLIDATRVNDYDDLSDEGYYGGLRAYKYVFLARYFGLDLGYEFDGAIFGPYSHKMGKECKTLDFRNMPPASAPPGLREDEFLAMASRGNDWVDVAARILHEEELDNNTTLLQICGSISNHEEEFIRSVHDEVHKMILAPAQAA